MRFRMMAYGWAEHGPHCHVKHGPDCVDIGAWALKGRCGGDENGTRYRNKKKTRRTIKRRARLAGRIDIQNQLED